jgi:hypothetical protein
VLAQSQPATISAGGYFGFEFLIPSQATVSFSANETTTDTWDVAIFTATEWSCYQNGACNQAYAGVHNGVMQVSDTVVLPPGDYYLGFHCTNVFERCMLVYSIDALY